MVFSSITFLFYFLPIFLALYFITPFKNTVLLIASLFFYAWGELGYVLLMVVSITINYLFGLMIAPKKRVVDRRNKLFLGLAIVINLLLLGYFKYFNFFFIDLMGLENDQVHLPLGISFFTFQAISYLIDVYRGDAETERNPFNLGLYISMFPQLIAGPIVRFKTVSKQIRNRVSSLYQISEGIKIFIIGLSQKVLVANMVALPADQIFSLGEGQLTTPLAWLGSLCYTLQIYFDFAGYSNMAIGLGFMMGFTFPENFAHPYISQSVTEFWRRWHKSLSQWFRDYLYIPLGGNRKGSMRTYFNLFVVFFLCGLWHGAAWTFIIWGMYQGLFLIIERLYLGQKLLTLWRPLRHVYLLFVVVVGWIIFRAENFDHMIYFMKAWFGFASVEVSNPYFLNFYMQNSTWLAVFIGIIFSMPVFQWLKQYFEHNMSPSWQSVSALSSELVHFFMLCLCMLYIASASYNPFIYFRF